MKDLRMRAMKAEDVAPLSAAFAAIGWHKPEETFRTYLEEQENGARWTRVAEVDESISGYVTLVWDSDDPSFRRLGVPEIMDLNVLPRFRGRGIGSALMQESEAEASARSPAVGVRVGLHRGYGAAQRLYAKRGYVPDGTGILVQGRTPEEGEHVPLDDDTILRLTKELEAG